MTPNLTCFLKLVLRSLLYLTTALFMFNPPATAQTPAVTPKAGGTVRVAIWSEPGTLNPYLSNAINTLTYQVVMDPFNAIAAQYRAADAPVESVTTPDECTAVVTYKQIFAGYREAFPWILPAHVFKGQTSIGQDPFNGAPGGGTGPFIFKSWSSGDSIQFDRNPIYRDAGKP